MFFKFGCIPSVIKQSIFWNFSTEIGIVSTNCGLWILDPRKGNRAKQSVSNIRLHRVEKSALKGRGYPRSEHLPEGRTAGWVYSAVRRSRQRANEIVDGRKEGRQAAERGAASGWREESCVWHNRSQSNQSRKIKLG